MASTQGTVKLMYNIEQEKAALYHTTMTECLDQAFSVKLLNNITIHSISLTISYSRITIC